MYKHRNQRLILITIVILALLSSQLLVSADHVIFFKDVKHNDWYYEAVTKGANRGIIYGYEDRTFRPNNNISMQEFLALYGRALVLVENKKEAISIINPNDFGIPMSSWAYKESQNILSRMNKESISKVDYKDISRPITREEVAFIVNNTLELTDTDEGIILFSDIGGSEFETDIKNLVKNNIVSGYPNNKFKPSDLITRAELVQIIDNMY